MRKYFMMRLAIVISLASLAGCYYDDSRDNPDDPRSEDNADVKSGFPAPPTNLAATTISETQIALSWASNAAKDIRGVTGFKIERIDTTYYKVVATLTVDEKMEMGDCCSFVDQHLKADKEYHYKVFAYNDVGESERSNEAVAMTQASLPSVLIAPTNLVAVAQSATQVDLSWSDNASDELGYYVEIKEGVGGTWGIATILGANIASFSDTGVVASTQYYYRVYAFNLDGNSLYSNEANATTPP